MDEGSSKLLVVICDFNREAWENLERNQDGSNVFQHCFDSLVVFCNSFVMLSPYNKIAFIACNNEDCKFIYPTSDIDTSRESVLHDGKYDLFTSMNEVIVDQVKAMMAAQSSLNEHNSTSLLAGALTKALCYIHSYDKNSINQGTQSRIFVLKASPDGSMHYMSVMNCIFAAQKENVVIDCCDMESNSGFLQRACSITGGRYFSVDNSSGLLGYLLWIFLPDVDLRQKLNLPDLDEVDHRAICFCHKRFLDVGFICSVCLSIYCQFVPKCQGCQTRFKLPPMPMPAKSKKKKKDTKKMES